MKHSCREPISSEERLMVALRFLVLRDSYPSLSYAFRIVVNTISQIVCEVCEAIYDELASEFIKLPKSNAEWKKISDEFESRWNCPHAFGFFSLMNPKKTICYRCSRWKARVYQKTTKIWKPFFQLQKGVFSCAIVHMRRQLQNIVCELWQLWQHWRRIDL